MDCRPLEIHCEFIRQPGCKVLEWIIKQKGSLGDEFKHSAIEIIQMVKQF